jgi:hypothetical protein
MKKLLWDIEIDYENWDESCILLMELISEDNTVEITVKFIGVDALKLETTCAAGQISGLAIADNTTLGYEIENRYYVNDFEEESICFYCRDIQVMERNHRKG